MKNLFKVVTVFATLALLVGTIVALSVSATEGDLTGETDATATATAVETTGTEAPALICGDANNDGVVNLKDVLFVRKYLADLEVDIDLVAADTNNDGEVNMKDVLNLRKFIADLVDALPVVETEPTAA